MDRFKRKHIFGSKVDGHSLLESVIALSLISIILTISTVVYSSVVSGGTAFSVFQEKIERKNDYLQCIEAAEDCDAAIQETITFEPKE